MALSGEITVDAKLDDQMKIIQFLAEPFKEAKLPKKQQGQVGVAIDEVFGNICMHGYKDKNGQVTFQYKISSEKDEEGNDKSVFWFCFIDDATEFNPLDSEMPDVGADLEHRDIGGLGLFIVGRIMDDVEYQFVDGHNKLNLIKYFSPEADA